MLGDLFTAFMVFTLRWRDILPSALAAWLLSSMGLTLAILLRSRHQ